MDYTETFGPIVKATTIRTILYVAMTSNWPIHQHDISNAFIHNYLSEEVYMEQPQWYVDKDHPNYVCWLQQSLYGLKQAPWAWYSRLTAVLKKAGHKGSKANSSLFYKSNGLAKTFVLIHVDDIIVTGISQLQVDEVLCLLSFEFPIKDLGLLHLSYVLRFIRHQMVLFSPKSNTLRIYCNVLVWLILKLVPTPMFTHPPLSKYFGKLVFNGDIYRQLVGGLQYLNLTRPDISFAVNKLCQFIQSPTDDHFVPLKRILRYLCGSFSLRLFIA